MRRARAAHRAAAEQRAAQIRAPAARFADDAPRRPLERRVARSEHSGLVQDAQRLSRRPRREAGTGSPGRRHGGGRCGSRSRRRARAAGVNARRATADSLTSRCSDTSPRPRRCRRPAEWKRPDSSARRSQSSRRRDARELALDVVRERHARARGAGACRRSRASRSRRARSRRRRDGTGRGRRSGSGRRTCPRRVRRPGVRRAPRARRT